MAIIVYAKQCRGRHDVREEGCIDLSLLCKWTILPSKFSFFSWFFYFYILIINLKELGKQGIVLVGANCLWRLMLEFCVVSSPLRGNRFARQ